MTKTWRDMLEVHPAADLFPMMAPDELKALGEDIGVILVLLVEGVAIGRLSL